MSAIATAVVGSAVIGAAASNKASKAQQGAADSANATQLEMYYQSRDDQAPWREVGSNALNELAMRLGVGGGGGSGSYSGGVGGTPMDSLAGAELVDTSSGVPRPNEELYATNQAYRDTWDKIAAEHSVTYKQAYNQTSDANWIEEQMRKRLSENIKQDVQAQRQSIESNPLYGSLTRNFTESDFWADPVAKLGFQFGLDEGTKGLNRQFAAGGSRDSGAALKALTRYATDYTGTKGNESFNRFNINRDSTYNKLASLAGVGQTASQQIGSQAMQTGQIIGQNQIGAGNARAASAIGRSNAISGAVGQGVNWWQQNQMMNNSQPWWNTADGINANGGGF